MTSETTTLSPEMATPEGRGNKLWALAREVLAETRHDFATLPLMLIAVLIGCSTMAIVSSALCRRRPLLR